MTRKTNGFALTAIAFLSMASRIALGHTSSFSTSATEGTDFVVQEGAPGGNATLFFCEDKRIVALNAKTGKVIWSAKGPGFENAGPSFGPMLSGKRLVYVAGGGPFTAYGLDTGSGKLKWKVDESSSALTVDRHAVFLSGLGSILKISSKTGKVEWKKDSGVRGWLNSFVYSSGFLFGESSKVWSAKTGSLVRRVSVEPDLVVSNGKRVYLWGTENIPLVAENSLTGKVLWRGEKVPKIAPDVTGQVYLAASSKYVAADFSYENMKNLYKKILFVYDADNGHLLWKKIFTSKQPSVFKPISVDSKFVYIVNSIHNNIRYNQLSVFNAQSGKPIWSYSNSEGIDGPVVSLGGKVFFSTFMGGGDSGKPVRGLVYALGQKTGHLIWVYRQR